MITTRCLWYMLLRCLTCSPLVSFVSYGCSLAASFFSILNLVVEFGVWGLTEILFWGFFTCVAQLKLFPREEPQKLSKSVNYCTFEQLIYGRNIYIYTATYTERLQPHFIHKFYSLLWNLPGIAYCQGSEKNLNFSLSFGQATLMFLLPLATSFSS